MCPPQLSAPGFGIATEPRDLQSTWWLWGQKGTPPPHQTQLLPNPPWHRAPLIPPSPPNPPEHLQPCTPLFLWHPPESRDTNRNFFLKDEFCRMTGTLQIWIPLPQPAWGCPGSSHPSQGCLILPSLWTGGIKIKPSNWELRALSEEQWLVTHQVSIFSGQFHLLTDFFCYFSSLIKMDYFP